MSDDFNNENTGLSNPPDGGNTPDSNITKVYPNDIDTIPTQTAEAMAALEKKRDERKKSRRKKIIITVLIVALIVIVIAGISIANMVSNATSNDVSTGEVTRGDFAVEISSNGELAPLENQTIAPEISTGTVDTVSVDQGDLVKEGDVLFTIDSPEVKNALKQSKLGVREAELSLQGAREQLQSAKDAYAEAQRKANDARSKAVDEYNKAVEEYNKALEMGVDVSQMDPGEFDESQFKFDDVQAQSAIDSAEQNVQAMQLGLESAQNQLEQAQEAADKLKVTSPVTGQVISSNVEPGTNLAILAQSGQTPMQIADTKSMTIDMQVHELDILYVKEGVDVEITFDAIPDLVAKGKVTSISATPASEPDAMPGLMQTSAGSGVTYYTVRVQLDNPDERLKIGMTAKCTMTLNEQKDVLLVPLTAVYEDKDGKTFVFVVTYDDKGNQQFDKRYIDVVASNSTQHVIEGDIAVGDLIALEDPNAETQDEDEAPITVESGQ